MNLWSSSRLAKYQDGWQEIFRVFVFLVGVLLVFTVILSFVWPFALAAFWDRLSQASHSPLKRAAITAALAVLGFLLYLARRFARIWYGAAETIAGVALCWTGLVTVSAKLAAAASVVGGVYVIVRGLDNIEVGLSDRQELAALARPMEKVE